MKSLSGGPFFAFSFPGGRRAPLPPISYAAAHSRKVPPPKPRVKAKLSLSGRNFITMHHQAAVNFENFTEVKLRDILLTGTGHQNRRLDSPGQTYGRTNLNQNVKPKSNFRFSVPSKKILRWANIWFSEHEHFNAEFKWITNFVNPVWEPLV